jgi:ferredoxin-NADP reductase
MAMLRHARRVDRSDRVRLVLSVRSPADLYYADELPGPESSVLYTREAPDDSTRPVGHINTADLAPLLRDEGFETGATAFICGSSRFADAASRVVVDAGIPAPRIRVERFGPTG